MFGSQDSSITSDGHCSYCGSQFIESQFKCSHCSGWGLNRDKREEQQEIKKAIVITGRVAKMIAWFIGFFLLSK